MKLKTLLNEPELISLVAQGDEKSFRKIFDFYSNKLFNYTLRITDNEELAEEIVMDAFLKIWMNRTDLAAIERFDSYLYTLIRNQAFNAVKRMAHEAVILKELGLSNTECHNDTEQTVIYNDYQQLLHNAVNELPPQQRLVFMLRQDEGMKYEEIADRLQLSKNTVKAHLKKAVSTLRTVFTNYMALTLGFYFFL